MNRSLLFFALTVALGATPAFAALTANDLEPASVNAAVAALPAAQRAAHVGQVIQAIAAMPADSDTRIAKIVSASRAAIAAASDGGATAVIAQLYISTPVDLLPGVAELLRPNFSQEVNGMDDTTYDAFCTRLIKNAADAIEISGTDAPATRMAILVATFVKGAKDPERVRALYTQALPSSVAEVAPTLVGAAMTGNVDQLAVSAGVDEVAEAPADPDRVVAATDAGGAQGEYFDSPAPGVVGEAAAGEPAPSEEKVVAVPLIARYVSDVNGMQMDMHEALFFDWETAIRENRDVLGNDAPIPTYPGFDVTTYPGFAEYAFPGLPLPSPGYANQGF